MALVINKTVDIDAPADLVWTVLTDFDRYGEWNPFVTRCSTTLQPGAAIDMRVRLAGRRITQREVIRSVTSGSGFSYAMKPVPAGALHSLRSHTLTAVDATHSRYTSHFELAGWLSSVVAAALGGSLREGFTGMTDAVKRRAESLA